MQQLSTARGTVRISKASPLFRQQHLKMNNLQVVDFLRFLAEGLRKGAFTLRAAKEAYCLQVSPLLELNVRVVRKPRRPHGATERIRLELSWKEGGCVHQSLQPIDIRCRPILDALECTPLGMTLYELGHVLGAPWRCLIEPVRKLFVGGRLLRTGKYYRLAQAIPHQEESRTEG